VVTIPLFLLWQLEELKAAAKFAHKVEGKKFTPVQIRSEYLAGKKDFRGLNLSELDLSGFVLSSADFTYANLSGTD
jgi:uncharacterized protein YjbI with pentapeptide repeats